MLSRHPWTKPRIINLSHIAWITISQEAQNCRTQPCRNKKVEFDGIRWGANIQLGLRCPYMTSQSLPSHRQTEHHALAQVSRVLLPALWGVPRLRKAPSLRFHGWVLGYLASSPSRRSSRKPPNKILVAGWFTKALKVSKGYGSLYIYIYIYIII